MPTANPIKRSNWIAIVVVVLVLEAVVVVAKTSRQLFSDPQFAVKAAQGSLAEVELGRLAARQGQTETVRAVALNERHLKRLLCEYVRYHHEDRTHLGLEKRTPDGRIRSAASGRVLSQERLGGLHHRYNRAA